MGFFKRQFDETINIFKSFKGNSRGCLLVEPMWGVPFNLFTPYASVYMLALGCNDTQVGLITSIGLLFQIFFSLISGYITDKFGRKKTSLIFDLISWSIPTLIWAFAQNFYYFLFAAIINSAVRVVHTSWSCLLIEDTKPSQRVHVYTWIQVAGILAGFFAPLAGMLVKSHGLIPSMRGLYLYAFVSMTAMFFTRNHLTHETGIGLQKMEITKNYQSSEVVDEYKRIFLELIKDPYTIIAFMLMVLNYIQITLKGTFFSILVTKGIGLPENTLSIFPAVTSAIMLFIFLFVMPTLGRRSPVKPLIFGFVLSIIGNLFLVFSPAGSFNCVMLSTVFSSVGAAVMGPFIESFVANSINDDDRAKVMSILYVIVIAISTPFGYIGGVLSSISEKLPFVLVSISFVISTVLICMIGKKEKKQATADLSL